MTENLGMDPQDDTRITYALERERLYGSRDIYFTEDVVDKVKETLQGKNLDVQAFRDYESSLRKHTASNDGDILKRYERLAETGDAGAAWRLAQIYHQNLLGLGYNNEKSEFYAEQAQKANLTPEVDRLALREWLKVLLFEDPNFAIDDVALDNLYHVFSGPGISQDACEQFELALREERGLDDPQIVSKYEEMAAGNLPGAAWRLYQIYGGPLLGVDKNPDRAYPFMTQASRAGLNPVLAQKGQGGYGGIPRAA